MENLTGPPGIIPDRSQAEIPGLSVVFMLFFLLLLGGLAKYTFRKIAMPYTVVLLLLGLGIGAILRQTPALEHYADVTHIPGHLFLAIFLPVLLFEPAFSLDFHVFRKMIVGILCLVGFGVALATTLHGVFAKVVFPYGWSWSMALLFGSIISPTDPVAVVALLRDASVSESLIMLVEGESLLNDGTAIVIFAVLKEMSMAEITGNGSGLSAGMIAAHFFYVISVGPLVGLLFGVLTVFVLSKIFNDNVLEASITLSMTYVTFCVTEHLLGSSGILSVTVYGLYVNVRGRTSISPDVEHFMHRVYSLLGYIANTLIFMLVGMIVSFHVTFELNDIGWLFLSYAWAYGTRTVIISTVSPLLKRSGYTFSFAHGAVLVHGALRGGVSLALAMLVMEDFGDKEPKFGDQALFQVAGIVVLTLLINGSTAGFVLRRLGLTKMTLSHYMVLTSAITYLRKQTERKLVELRKDRFLSDSNWRNVREWCYYPRLPEEKFSLSDFQSLRDNVTVSLRKRLLVAERVSYWNQFGEGLIGQEELLALLASVQRQLDMEENLAHFESVSTALEDVMTTLRISPSLMAAYNRLSRLPFVRILLQRLIFQRIFFAFRLGVAYVRSQKAMEDLVTVARGSDSSDSTSPEWEHFGLTSLETSDDQHGTLPQTELIQSSETHLSTLDDFAIMAPEDVHGQFQSFTDEKIAEVSRVLVTLREAFPEIASAAKSSMASHSLLHYQYTVVKSMVNSGTLEEEVAEPLFKGIEEVQKRIRSATPIENLPSPQELIMSIPWVQGSEIMPQVLLHYVRERNFRSNETLIREDEPVDGVILVVRGIAKILSRNQFVGYAGPGEAFGEVAVLTGGKSAYSVVAETYLVALVISNEGIRELLIMEPRTEHRMWRSAAARLTKSMLMSLKPYSDFPAVVLDRMIRDSQLMTIHENRVLEFAVYAVVVIAGSARVVQPGRSQSPSGSDRSDILGPSPDLPTNLADNTQRPTPDNCGVSHSQSPRTQPTKSQGSPRDDSSSTATPSPPSRPPPHPPHHPHSTSLGLAETSRSDSGSGTTSTRLRGTAQPKFQDQLDEPGKANFRSRLKPHHIASATSTDPMLPSQCFFRGPVVLSLKKGTRLLLIRAAPGHYSSDRTPRSRSRSHKDSPGSPFTEQESGTGINIFDKWVELQQLRRQHHSEGGFHTSPAATDSAGASEPRSSSTGSPEARTSSHRYPLRFEPPSPSESSPTAAPEDIPRVTPSMLDREEELSRLGGHPPGMGYSGIRVGSGAEEPFRILGFRASGDSAPHQGHSHGRDVDQRSFRPFFPRRHDMQRHLGLT